MIMKIQKFTENIKNSSNKSEKLVKNVMNEYDNICNLIYQFIIFENIEKNIKSVTRYYYETNVSVVGDTAMFYEFIKLKDDGDYPVFMLNEDELEKLYEFIDNPSLYKSTRKYNL